MKNVIKSRNAIFLAALVSAYVSSATVAAQTIVGLITQTNTNPFDVKIKEGAFAKSKQVGVTLHTYAGKSNGDVDGQITAIEQLIAAGAKGILLVPNDPSALLPTVKKARAAGVLVVTLAMPLDPPTAADANFSSDNFEAGELIGRWAKATLGVDITSAKIAMLDFTTDHPPIDIDRHNGFLNGIGIVQVPTVGCGGCDCSKDSCKRTCKECNAYSPSTKEIVGSDVTTGSLDGGRRAMENIIQKNSRIDLVYAFNYESALGAYAAFKSAGKEPKTVFVTIGGGCRAVKSVREGIIGATVEENPFILGEVGVDAVAIYAKNGGKPENSPGKEFINIGVSLVTDRPVARVPSVSTETAAKFCWG